MSLHAGPASGVPISQITKTNVKWKARPFVRPPASGTTAPARSSSLNRETRFANCQKESAAADSAPVLGLGRSDTNPLISGVRKKDGKGERESKWEGGGGKMNASPWEPRPSR